MTYCSEAHHLTTHITYTKQRPQYNITVLMICNILAQYFNISRLKANPVTLYCDATTTSLSQSADTITSQTHKHNKTTAVELQ